MIRVLLITFLFSFSLSAKVFLFKVPDEGLSPQCATDSKGVAHMIYFKGSVEAGDIYYTTFNLETQNFNPSVRVNSIEGSATIQGTTSHPQMAVGKNGVVHVVWNGSAKAENQFLYSKSIGDGQFSPQKDMKGETSGIDGGGSVAANGLGQVFLVWHANTKGKTDEQDRQVFISISKDNGTTFTEEKVISPKYSGASSGCSLKVAASSKEVMILFRGVSGRRGIDRNIYQLTSRNKGLSFNSRIVEKENSHSCPRSSYAITTGIKDFVRAWDYKDRVYCRVNSGKAFLGSYSFEKKSQKHPSLSRNIKEYSLLAWVNNGSQAKEAELEWVTFDKNGRTASSKVIQDGVKPSSVIGTFSIGNDFVIVH